MRLAAGRRVLLPEQRAHGRTADPGEVSYPLMAADTVGFLEAVVGGPADLVGWSDGGNVALHVALARPDLVRKVVVIGSNFHHEGTIPALIDGMERRGLMLRSAYEEVSPDGPEHWPEVKREAPPHVAHRPHPHRRGPGRHRRLPCWSWSATTTPSTSSHTIALYEALPAGQLAIVPGTSHLVPIEKPALVNQLIVDFLDDGSVLSFLPMRRQPEVP